MPPLDTRAGWPRKQRSKNFCSTEIERRLTAPFCYRNRNATPAFSWLHHCQLASAALAVPLRRIVRRTALRAFQCLVDLGPRVCRGANGLRESGGYLLVLTGRSMALVARRRGRPRRWNRRGGWTRLGERGVHVCGNPRRGS